MKARGQDSFIRALPKAELHLHIEGTLEPELMFAIAKRNKVKLRFKSADEVRKAYAFTNLQSFLDIYYEGAAVLIKEEDFYDLAWAYLEKAAKDNVRRAEIFFDPQTHVARGVHIKTVIMGLRQACLEARHKLNISAELILCFLRHLSPEEAMQTLNEALPFQEHFIAVGLDSSEKNRPPELFKGVYSKARANGLKAVAHAGEEGPPDYIEQALDLLKVSRVDHGVRCAEDSDLVRRLAAEKIPLTMCPLSNVKLCVFKSLKDHNLKQLLAQGVRATINSDDPAYFGGYALDNFIATQEALALSKAELVLLAKNSFEASFLPAAEKKRFVREIETLEAA
jgi:adenosine deaminase